MPTRIYTVRPPSNPILQVLYFLIGGILLIGAVIMGAVILAFVLGIAVIVGIVVYARVWWLNRKYGRGKTTPTSATASDGEILEVEYTVVEERDERDI